MRQTIVAGVLVLIGGLAFADHHETGPLGYGQVFSISASDPAAVVAALEKYRTSEAGKKMPTSVTINEVLAGGAPGVTHTIGVYFGPAANIDKTFALRGTPERAETGKALRAASERVSVGMYAMLRRSAPEGKVTAQNPVNWLYFVEVTDQEAFMAAFDKLWGEAVGSFPGNLTFGQVLVNGESPATHFMSFQTNDMATLLSGVQNVLAGPAGVEYASKASSFRNITSEGISRTVARWAAASN